MRTGASLPASTCGGLPRASVCRLPARAGARHNLGWTRCTEGYRVERVRAGLAAEQAMGEGVDMWEAVSREPPLTRMKAGEFAHVRQAASGRSPGGQRRKPGEVVQ